MTDRTERGRDADATGADANPPVRRLDDWDADSLRGLAEEYGTPLYVLDLDRVRANYRRLARAFPGAEIRYAAKANAPGPVLETLSSAGAGVECASAGEVHRALAAGVPGARVHYTAVNPPARDVDAVVDAWRENPDLTVTAGAADTIDRLLDRGYDGRLCLRITPDVGAGHHEKVRTGSDVTFGVPADRAVDVLADAADRGLEPVGVHAHVGSGLSNGDLAAHREFVSRMGEFARAAADRVGDLEFVDVGGGFGVPYREDESPLDLGRVATATREALGDVDATLVIEPGRYLVADAGVLLTRANTVKETAATTVVGVDAGMTALLRPAMYDAYHPIRNLAADAGERGSTPQTLAGPVCESSDVLCADRPLPAPEREDVLAVGNAGAYGYEMASHYTSRPRPASVVLADGRARLARRRETVHDVTRPERAARDAAGERESEAEPARDRRADGEGAPGTNRRSAEVGR